ncbi:MAG: acyl-CoA thioesterase [Candidatus Acidiferrales bacterium]
MRFADCDPAGIVFYPRYFEMFNDLVEDWCSEGLQHSFTEIVTRRGWGLPTVHTEVDFAAPSVFGETLSSSLSVSAIGASSMTLQIALRGPEGEERVRGTIVLVLIDRKLHRPIAIPDDLRARIREFQPPV